MMGHLSDAARFYLVGCRGTSGLTKTPYDFLIGEPFA